MSPNPARRPRAESPELDYALSSEVPPVPEGEPTLAESVLLWLFRRFPPETTIFRDRSDDSAREYESEREWPFWRYFGRGPELFDGRAVLDLGCGWGGRAARWLEIGASSVCGVEIAASQVVGACAFAEKKGFASRVQFLVGTGEDIPCEPGSFDLVVMNDVMEHVIDPGRVLSECFRVLRPGGRLATVFPPYYDVHGGSHLDGYATSFPGLNLIFPTRAVKGATLRLFAEQGVDHRHYLRDVPSDKLWNMNGLTIRRFRQLLRRSQFEIEQLWLVGHFDRRLFDTSAPCRPRWRAALRLAVFGLSELAARTPLIQEATCSRVCAVLRKPNT
jgi:SAM-dependent methyltransferase